MNTTPKTNYIRLWIHHDTYFKNSKKHIIILKNAICRNLNILEIGNFAMSGEESVTKCRALLLRRKVAGPASFAGTPFFRRIPADYVDYLWNKTGSLDHSSILKLLKEREKQPSEN